MEVSLVVQMIADAGLQYVRVLILVFVEVSLVVFKLDNVPLFKVSS